MKLWRILVTFEGEDRYDKVLPRLFKLDTHKNKILKILQLYFKRSANKQTNKQTL